MTAAKIPAESAAGISDQKEVSPMRDALLALCAYVVTIVVVTRR